MLARVVSEFVQENDLSVMKLGRYDLENGCYVNLDEYETKENIVFEAHRKYIDVQIIISGKEKILYAPLNCGIEESVYSEEKDVAFYTCYTNDYSEVCLEEGEAVVLFPEDLHAPCNWDVKLKNRKAVFKIPISLVG